MTASVTSDLLGLVDPAMRTRGYHVLPDVLDGDLVTQVRQELDTALDAERQGFGTERLVEVGMDGYVSDVPAMGPATLRLLDQDVLHDVLAMMLGRRPRLAIAQGIALEPGTGRGRWPRRWHADLYQMRQALPDPGFCFGLNCLVVLDDMTEANGATCVVPGSHAFVDPCSDNGAEMEGVALSVQATAGSILLLDGGLWHAAGHNRSTASRRVLKLLFVRSWIRPQLDYRRTVTAQVSDALPVRVAGLFGIGPTTVPELGPQVAAARTGKQ